jgi:hypothetical protein
MKKTSEMTPLEKSLALCQLNPAWNVDVIENEDGSPFGVTVVEWRGHAIARIYLLGTQENLFTADKNDDPHFAGLAWRIINWATEGLGENVTFLDWLEREPFFLAAKPPARAQTEWLEAILRLSSWE